MGAVSHAEAFARLNFREGHTVQVPLFLRVPLTSLDGAYHSYLLLSQDIAPLYAGVSGRISKRMSNHLGGHDLVSREWFRHIAWGIFTPWPSKDEAYDHEAHLIDVLRPPHNRMIPARRRRTAPAGSVPRAAARTPRRGAA